MNNWKYNWCLFVTCLLLWLIPHETKAQEIVPPQVTEVGPDTLTFNVIGTGSDVISASYFKFVYNPETIVIHEVFTDLPDWYVVDKRSPGVIEIAALSPVIRLFDGAFFKMDVEVLQPDALSLVLVDTSWTDCRNIKVTPPVVRPTDPSPEEVAGNYNGVTYWVSSVGSDNNTCDNFDTPCRTTKPFDQALSPGDAVVFMGGTHRIQVQPIRSGVPGNPITYTSYPGQTAIISGADLVSGWILNNDGTYTIPYRISLPQHPAAAMPQVQWRPEMLIVNGKVYQTLYNDSELFPFESFYVKGPSNNPEHMRARFDGRDPNMLVTEVATRDTLFVPKQPISDIVVHGLTFTHAGNSYQKMGCVEVNGSNWTVYDVVVEWCNTTGIKFYGSDHNFYNVAANHNGVVGWNAEGATDVIIANSQAIGNNWKGFLPNWHAGGLKLTHGTSRVVIDGMVSTDNNGPGLWFDIPWGMNNVVTNSYFSNNQLAGVFLEHGTVYTKVENNIIYGTRKYNGSGAGIRIQAASDNVFSRNTVYGNSGSGVFEKYKDRRSPPGHNLFIKNVIGYNGTDSSSDYEIRIDRDAGEKIVDHFSDNLIVAQIGSDLTFKIENGWQGNDVTNWMKMESHFGDPDRVLPRSTKVLENPLSPDGWKVLIEGYGAVILE